MGWQETPRCPTIVLFLGVSAHALGIPLGVQGDSFILPWEKITSFHPLRTLMLMKGVLSVSVLGPF